MNDRANGTVVTKQRTGSAIVLSFIQAEVAAGNPFPTAGQIAAQFGWHKSSADDCLNRLVVNGHLEVDRREPSGRGWRYWYRLRK